MLLCPISGYEWLHYPVGEYEKRAECQDKILSDILCGFLATKVVPATAIYALSPLKSEYCTLSLPSRLKILPKKIQQYFSETPLLTQDTIVGQHITVHECPHLKRQELALQPLPHIVRLQPLFQRDEGTTRKNQYRP